MVAMQLGSVRLSAELIEFASTAPDPPGLVKVRLDQLVEAHSVLYCTK